MFGFFVSGPGINGPFTDGAINVARIPDSEDFVSINNVNHEKNENYYVKNELRDDIDNCNLVFNPSHLFTIEYDGFTVPLVARIQVTPCETYHIRLVVGDVGDDKLDSAVFLRAKSFDLGQLATVKAVLPNQTDSVAYENCLDGQFVFTRPEGSFNLRPLDLDFEIDESSTALEGIDFSSIPRTVTIPEGLDTVVLSIPTLEDQQAESLESLTLNLNFTLTCDCQEGSSATLNFVDAKPPTLLNEPIFACAGQSFSIVPQVQDGVPPFSYLWDNNSTDISLQTSIQAPAYFGLTISDFCNNQTSDSVQVNIQEVPTGVLSGDIDYCEGINANLPINYNGHPPWSFTYQVNTNSPVTIDSIFDNNFNLPIAESGNYQLIAFRDAACSGVASGSAQVNDINIEVELEAIPPSCPDVTDSQINLTILAGSPPYDINWSPTVNDVVNPTNLSAGIYYLRITDAQNCVFTDSLLIENPSLIGPECANNRMYVPNVFSPNGDGINDFFEIFLDEPSSIQKILKVEIIDRWGNLVYLTEGKMPKWDGRFGGEISRPAVFLYRIQVELADGQTELVQGNLSLIR